MGPTVTAANYSLFFFWNHKTVLIIIIIILKTLHCALQFYDVKMGGPKVVNRVKVVELGFFTSFVRVLTQTR